MTNDFAKDLEALIQKIHPSTAHLHDKLYSLENVMKSEHAGLLNHLAHFRAEVLVCHDQLAERLTEVAKLMGYVPALPPPIQQMQIPEDVPRVVRQTRAERTVDDIYGQLAN